MNTQIAAELFEIAENIEMYGDQAGGVEALLALIAETLEVDTYERDAVLASKALAAELHEQILAASEELYDLIPRLQHLDQGEVSEADSLWVETDTGMGGPVCSCSVLTSADPFFEYVVLAA